MKKPEDKSGQGEGQPSASSPPSDEGARMGLLRIIIERYREEIELHESKSVTDLKGMVQPHSAEIISMRDSILSSFRPYVFEEHFPEAAKMCFSFVRSFATISPPVTFWLAFSEMREIMAGDEIDKSILLCSLLRAAGSENARVFVTDSKNSYVAFEFSGRHFLADHEKESLSEAAGWEGCLTLMKGKLIYSFNDREYEDFQEQ